ncbi:MAG TPA: peptidoglycan DD-metalloendopeptidase family protein [Candidatus Eubacterium faecipullorum]|uniref:Peptidoglycan DD-metalloendopeptidase family protein n=1 Tax=Candidatus Eubacterium faecipullorum TaxID=2838571 RepID=A0A9D1UHD1_9FIRM|nr:peptidoglycan DD-metalloendopeptidase family protein [Candidatus Eubacterium faecipullorum]
MKHKSTLKILCAALCAVTVLTPFHASIVPAAEQQTASQQESTTETTQLTEEQKREEARKKLEDQKFVLEADLAEAEQKIAALAADSKTTEEYINALDEKIGILNQQLTVLDEQVLDYEEDIKLLQTSIEENQKQADTLQAQVDSVQAELDDLNTKFMAKYDAYCLRMRAIYISGDYNLITALLTCSDISSFFTRYEMIRAVSKSDAQLMQEIQEQTEIILARESDLNEKKAALNEMNTALFAQQNELEYKQAALTAAQEDIAAKKITLAQDKAESDQLFARLTAETGMYTEYRNEDQALSDAAQQQIEDLMNGIISPEDVSDFTTGNRDETPTVIYNDTDVYNNSDGVYNMIYPVPGHYTVSAGFPNYSNGSYHGGIDFPCPTGTKVVAAQKGVVAGVKRLDYSYGYYVLIYHGTDSNGDKVFTLYAHNSELLVSPGDSVYKGQQIAKSGSTGNSTGPHCHFEIRAGGTRINPKNYLSK